MRRRSPPRNRRGSATFLVVVVIAIFVGLFVCGATLMIETATIGAQNAKLSYIAEETALFLVSRRFKKEQISATAVASELAKADDLSGELNCSVTSGKNKYYKLLTVDLSTDVPTSQGNGKATIKSSATGHYYSGN